MGMTQSWIMSRLRIKCFSLESWVDLNQYLGICLSMSWFWVDSLESRLRHESIWINTWGSAWVASWFWVNSLKSRLIHELNRFKFPRYCLSHELIPTNRLLGKTFESKAQKGHIKSNRNKRPFPASTPVAQLVCGDPMAPPQNPLQNF